MALSKYNPLSYLLPKPKPTTDPAQTFQQQFLSASQTSGQPVPTPSVQYSAPIGPQPFTPSTSVPQTQQTQSSVVGYTRKGNDVYDAQGNYISFAEAQKRGIVPLLAGIPQGQPAQSTDQPAQQTPPLSLSGEDFAQFRGDTDIKAAQAERDQARANEQKAFETGQQQMGALIESSQKMFNDLYNSPGMQQAKQGQAQAFTELSRLDAEQQNATFNLKQSINQKGTPSWAAAGQLRIVAEGYNAQKAGYLSQLAISSNALEQGYKYAEQAYNANLNTLNAKIGLVENALTRAKDLSAQEKSDYEDVLARAKELYDEKKTNAKESSALYLQLVQAGVSGLTPTMSVNEMSKIAGPELVRQAKAMALAASEKAGLEAIKTRAEIAKIQAEAREKQAIGAISPYQDERSIRTVQSVDELLAKAKKNPGIFGRTAAAPIPEFLRSDAYRNFDSELNTLKSNISFGELTAMREASKTGGALGQVSNIELGLLESALGALKLSQSPENFQAQLQKVKESINRWREAMGASQLGGGSDLASQVRAKGYDYQSMKADGLLDEEIKKAVGI